MFLTLATIFHQFLWNPHPGSVEITSQSPDIYTLERGPALDGQYRTNSSIEDRTGDTGPLIVRLECYGQGERESERLCV